MNNRSIPIVVITNLTNSEEYRDNWGLPGKSSWILEKEGPFIMEFSELKGIDTTIGWEKFPKLDFPNLIGHDIVALVLDGTIKKPHPLEVLRHLLLVEDFKVGYLLIHCGGGNIPISYIDKNTGWSRPPDDCLIYLPGWNEYEMKFHPGTEEEKTVQSFVYSRGATTNIFYEWIIEISTAIKLGNLTCATDRLKVLPVLLGKFKDSGYSEKIIKSNPPAPCCGHKIASKIIDLFLDLRFDLMGLSELLQEKMASSMEIPTNQMGEIDRYFKDIVEEKGKVHFRQKLADARFLAFGKTFGNGTLAWEDERRNSSVPKEESEICKRMFSKSNLNDILKDNDFKAEREKLSQLLGLTGEYGDYSENPQHEILKFLNHLDCITDRMNGEMDDHGIKMIVEFYEIFLKWYDDLVELIDSIKEKIK